MPKKLVIVESPAKAKTIKKFLGGDFDVHASVGHVADLPSKGLAVDVDNHFEPTYELTERGKQVIKDLKARLREADELYLATDEDREGEAISWHLVRALRPRIPVKRMVFHEITQSAIDSALANPREVDQGLVDAAETRRILDRLYGYEVSPVLWRRVNRGLSAGRVQSPTVRLVVERERERRAFVKAPYWSLELETGTQPAFTASLVALDGAKVATGKDFDSSGQSKAGVVVVDGARAEGLAERLRAADFAVRSVEEKPYTSSPRPPFMTSTLQQDGSRRLRLSAAHVMRLAQGLYERGFITYMRTDSVELSRDARGALRNWVGSKYGDEYLPPSPRSYRSKVKNAQEAHEAIRPTVPLRAPEEVAREINNKQELELYRLIWQRSLASQMADAKGTTVSVRLGAVAAMEGGSTDCEFAASGTTITFQGYRRAYAEAQAAGADSREALLPKLAAGDPVPVESVTPNGHETTPPARYTEAAIVKRLEELGIGRPSTWASIIQTVQDRGYVWKKGQALVPTWTAFAVVGLMEQHFDDLVDYAFTARVEADLDAIARQEMDKETWLRQFYLGDEQLLGLKKLVEQNLDEIDAAQINTFPLGTDPESGATVVVKPGRYGPYVKRGDDDTASVPDNLPPDELTLEVALELLAAPKSDEPIGAIDGLPVFAKNGRYGPYVQWGTADEPPPGYEKPKMSSLFKTMSLDTITLDDAKTLLSLPRTLGKDPADGEPILVNNGRYGPYVQKGRDFRSIETEEQLLTITLEQALALLAQPKVYRRGGRAPAKPLRELGEDPVSGRPVVAKEGRFGIYVSDGETNASIGRGDRIEEMTKERAWELLAVRRESAAAGGGKKKKAQRKSTKKKASKKKASKKAKSTKKSAKSGKATKKD